MTVVLVDMALAVSIMALVCFNEDKIQIFFIYSSFVGDAGLFGPFISAVYPSGFPSYSYLGSNTIQTSASTLCTSSVVITFYYNCEFDFLFIILTIFFW